MIFINPKLFGEFLTPADASSFLHTKNINILFQQKLHDSFLLDFKFTTGVVEPLLEEVCKCLRRTSLHSLIELLAAEVDGDLIEICKEGSIKQKIHFHAVI